MWRRFRPLAGCGLFLKRRKNYGKFSVFVPLRGVDCFEYKMRKLYFQNSFRPLAGCGLFLLYVDDSDKIK